MNYPSKKMELNVPNFVNNCLKILENFTLMLLNTNEKINRLPKLNYCYCYFNAIRWQLGNSTSLHDNFVMEIAKSIINRLQSSLGILDSSKNYLNISTEYSKNRSILSPIIGGYNVCRRNSKRKSKLHKKRPDLINRDNPKVFLNKFYDRLFGINKSANNQKAFSTQYIIDQMYIQILTVLSENRIDETDIFKELNMSVEKDILSKSILSKKSLSPIMNQEVKGTKYQEQLWSGECKLFDDSRNIFSDQFDKPQALNNLDLDLTSLTDRIFSSNNGFLFPNKRFRNYSELDEGFSENDFLCDIDNKQDENESSEFVTYEQFSYCGDCHYNSNNSKSDEKQTTDHYIHRNETPIQLIDDGSDSDGGTELLNSVNDTVNRFNAFMQYNLSADNTKQLEEMSSNFSLNSIEQMSSEDVWLTRYPNIADNRTCYDEFPNNAFQNKSFEKNELLAFDHNPSISLLSDSITYKDGRYESKMVSVNNLQHQYSASSLSNFNYDSFSKMVVSPISIQNWCYNFSHIASPSYNFGYQIKPTLNIDTSNYLTENFCAGKLPNRLPPISHGLITSNSYIIGPNNPQQPFHRIMITPYLSLPQGNMGPMQHNIIHLPHISHQFSHSFMDTDYLNCRQIPINLSTQFSNPNNNSDSDFSIIPSTNLIANSNCSNMTSSTNLHQPISIIKSSLNKSQRACCFYMRGGCKKEDCEYAHDLSKVTCKFWEKGDCFKADTCPFKHGYMKE